MPKINFKEDQVLESFIHQMVVDKGLVEEDRNQNGKIQHELMMQLDEAIERAMIRALTDVQLVELNAKLDAGMSDDEMERFFVNSGMDAKAVAGKAMAEFRREYLGETNNMTSTKEARTEGPVQGTTSEMPGASDVEGQAAVMGENR